MNKAELIRILRALPYDPAEYWLVAGGAMVLYGLREETADVDLGCSAALADRLAAEGHPFRLTSDGRRTFHIGGELEVFEGWYADRITSFEGVPVVSLRGLLEMKRALGREKDLRDVKRIEAFLADNPSAE